MTSLVRRYLKTAIAFLGVGLTLGGWMMIRRELVGAYPSPYLVSAHTHAILVGFVKVMILGVALWLFPRPDKEDTRYRPALVECAYWLLTVATAGRVIGELLRTLVSALWLRGAVVALGLAQIGAIFLFFFTMWSRIRPLGSQRREANGGRF